jgi:hypothetical protein
VEGHAYSSGEDLLGIKLTVMATPKEIAQWMVTQLDESEQLLQVEAVAAIEKLFGPEFVYLSDLGEMSIDRRVLYHFRKWTQYEY